jgi:hypothetical protein
MGKLLLKVLLIMVGFFIFFTFGFAVFADIPYLDNIMSICFGIYVFTLVDLAMRKKE